MSKDLRSSNASDLDLAGTLTGAEIIGVERNGRDYQTTATAVADLGTGGGGVTNWCSVAVNITAALTVGSSDYAVQAADLSIASQTGTDFTVIDSGSVGAIRTASGGVFQACFYVGPGFTSTFDGGSAAIRWYTFGYSVGDSGAGNPGDGLGLDGYFPANINANLVDTHASSIGVAAPGGLALHGFGFNAAALFGTDSLALDGISMGVVWQVG